MEAAELGKCTATIIGVAPPGYGALPSTCSHPGGSDNGAGVASGAGGDDDTASTTATTTSSAFYKKIAAIMASRFVFVPLIAAGLLSSGIRTGLIPADKLIWFVLLMEACMPSAQNSVIVLQMENKSDLAASLATTLAVLYLLSAVPIALLLSVILQFVHI